MVKATTLLSYRFIQGLNTASSTYSKRKMLTLSNTNTKSIFGVFLQTRVKSMLFSFGLYCKIISTQLYLKINKQDPLFIEELINAIMFSLICLIAPHFLQHLRLLLHQPECWISLPCSHFRQKHLKVQQNLLALFNSTYTFGQLWGLQMLDMFLSLTHMHYYIRSSLIFKIIYRASDL